MDGDGDWDAVFANGGVDGREQNRIWINQGGQQGGTTGMFEDETAVRVPALLDQSRDIDFADIDGDTDLTCTFRTPRRACTPNPAVGG